MKIEDENDDLEQRFIETLGKFYSMALDYKQNLAFEYSSSAYFSLSEKFQNMTEELDRHTNYRRDPLYEYINQSQTLKSGIQAMSQTSLDIASKFEAFGRGDEKFSRVNIQRLLNSLLIQIESLARMDMAQLTEHSKPVQREPSRKATAGPESSSEKKDVPASSKGSPLKVFLCHSSDDRSVVREIYQRLTQVDNVDPWLDKENILPGQDWDYEIENAIRKSDVILVCLSNGSATKEGYVQKEIKRALDIADQKPEGTIFIIPLKLEECNVPNRLGRWQWVDYFEEDGFQKLLVSLRLRAGALSAK